MSAVTIQQTVTTRLQVEDQESQNNTMILSLSPKHIQTSSSENKVEHNNKVENTTTTSITSGVGTATKAPSTCPLSIIGAAHDVNQTDKHDGQVWNWSGSILLLNDQTRVYEPTSEQELAQLIKTENDRKKITGKGGVKVVGSKLASSPIAQGTEDNQGIMICMTHFKQVMTETENSITVGSGTQLGFIFNYLLDKGKMLPVSPGVITYQTIAGALATCTHGQGLYQSSLSDAVLSMRVALADGSIVDVDGNDARLPAFKVSLGCLGVVISVTLRTAPAQLFVCHKEKTDIDFIRTDIAPLNAQHAFFKNWWFPMNGSGDVHMWKIDYLDPAHVPSDTSVKRKRWAPDGSFTEEPISLGKFASAPSQPLDVEGTLRSIPGYKLSATPITSSALSSSTVNSTSDSLAIQSSLTPRSSPSTSSQSSSFSSSSDVAPSLLEGQEAAQAIRDTINMTISKMQEHTHDSDHGGHGAKSWTVKRFGDFEDVIGPVDYILCKQVPPRQVNFELSIPLAQAQAAIDELRAWFTHPENSGLPIHYPVIMRCTGGSDIWLSPAYGQEPFCYFGFLVYLAPDGSILDDSLAYLRGVQEILCRYGARPHWGKYFSMDMYPFPQLYPKWQDFADLRSSLDPNGIFMNPFLTSLFGSSSVSA